MDADILRAIENAGTVITVNRRLARALHQEYSFHRLAQAQQSGKAAVWERPQILPLGAWLGELWTRHVTTATAPVALLLTTCQEGAVWEETVTAAIGDRPLRVGPVADLAMRAATLVAEYEIGSSELTGSTDVEEFARWHRSFLATCRKKSWLPGALLITQICEFIAGGVISVPKLVAFAGFDEFTPQQRSLMRVLSEAGSEVQTFDPWAAASLPFRAKRVALPDPNIELVSAAKWARRILEERSGEAGTIGVVVPNLHEVRPLVERVFRDVFHPESILPTARELQVLFNVSLGRPLVNEPVVVAAIKALELAMDSLEIDDAGVLLRSPFLRGGADELVPRALIDRRLRKDGHATVTIDALVRCLARMDETTRQKVQNLARILDNLRRHEFPREAAPAEWADAFARALELAGWPDLSRRTSSEFQAIKSFRSALGEFASLDLVRTTMDASEALARLRAIASAQLFQPEGSMAPVQVVGLLEATALKFDHVWVVGMHSTAWPRPADANPFLPPSVQRQRGIPRSSSDLERAFAMKWTGHMARSAGEAIFSYSRQPEEKEASPSSLIAAFPETPAEELVPPETVTYAELIAGQNAEAVTTLAREDDPAPSLKQGEHVHGGTWLFQKQALCPFSAFARFRLAAEALEQPVPGLDARSRGTLVHLVLEKVWARLRTAGALRAIAQRDAEYTALLVQCVAEATDETLAGSSRELAPALDELEQQRLVELAREWLDVELSRTGDFEVIEQEAESEQEFAGVKVRMRIDRIDRVEEGLLLIDYKTGKASPSKWLSDRPEEPQLPIYCLLRKDEVMGAYYACLGESPMVFRGGGGVPKERMAIKREDKKLSAWPERLQSWETVLQALGDEIRAGRADVAPKHPQVCRNCDFRSLCRLDEANSAARLAMESEDQNGADDEQ